MDSTLPLAPAETTNHELSGPKAKARTTVSLGRTFLPQGQQQAPSGPTQSTFTAEFQTYPGTNTNAINILLNYKNPADTDNNWPSWTVAQAQAYKTFTMIAAAGSQGGLSDLKNFTDFRQVGDEIDPGVLSTWLNAVWAPFQTLLNGASNPNVIVDTYNGSPVIQMAYRTEASFATFATAFLGSKATQDAYTSVDELLAGANSARKDIHDDFLLSLESWNTASQVQLGSDPTLIADLLTTNPTAVPQLPKPVEPGSWFKGR
jgi:hypothetical protein